MRLFYVYILSSQRNGTLYIGVTNNLSRRLYEHKSKKLKGLTKKYAISNLVYYEASDSIQAALRREKQLKAWKRVWKLQLIEKENPEWKCLTSITNLTS